LVDKPGHRKKKKTPWGKITAAVIGVLIVGAIGYYVYDTYIYSPPPVYARLGTSQGYIYAELFPACTPRTVANFVNLTQTGFYTNLVWHRIVNNPTAPEFVIQTGDPNTKNAVNSTRSTWGMGQSKQQVPFEWCGWLHNYAGYIGMASTAQKGPSTSQFYIMLSNNTSYLNTLDGNYTVFGKVISGMSVVCTIASVNTYPENSTLKEQPVNPASAMLDNVTILQQAQAPTSQPIAACKS